MKRAGKDKTRSLRSSSRLFIDCSELQHAPSERNFVGGNTKGLQAPPSSPPLSPFRGLVQKSTMIFCCGRKSHAVFRHRGMVHKYITIFADKAKAMIVLCTEAGCINLSWFASKPNHDNCMHRGLVHKSIMIVLPMQQS